MSRTRTDHAKSENGNGVDLVASARFLLAWSIIPVLFFSLSAGKRGVYLLPIFPALALVAALAGTRSGALAQLTWLATRRLIWVIAAVATIELAGFTLVLPLLDDEKSPRPISESIVSVARGGESVGVYGMTPLEGGLAYYGAKSLVSLRDENDLNAFVGGEGRLVILRARHFEALGPKFRLREIRSFRSGRRRLTLAERVSPLPQRENR